MDTLDTILGDIQDQADQDAEAYLGAKAYALWRDPTHVGTFSRPDGVGDLTGACGDSIQIEIRVDNEHVREARFWTDGCGPSIVSGCAACILAENKTLEEAASLQAVDIIRFLGGLPEDKEHCAHLAARTLQEAVAHFIRTQGD
ncbi:MAG: iron-sulfur cluster assembly scaffold protein [Thermodesulfobacteriota bacterium]